MSGPLVPLAPLLLLAGSVALVGLSLASCSSVSNERIGIDAPPFSQATFTDLNGFLVYRCGTNDCHGAPGRNFRVFGCDGLRLDAGQTVSCIPDDAGAGPTTISELQATYRSLVGLEPQVMSTVFQGCSGARSPEGGAAYPPPVTCHPELLTLLEKARGAQKHKGGQLICLTPPCPPGIPPPNPYDLQDECIVTWLEGNVNVNACQMATFLYGMPVADASAE